jgi:pimeloyl-ACP methyl ester carboxylesterase
MIAARSGSSRDSFGGCEVDAGAGGGAGGGARALRTTTIRAASGRARALEVGEGAAVVVLASASAPPGTGAYLPLLEALAGRFRGLVLELEAPDPERAEARDARLVSVGAEALATVGVGRAIVVGHGASGRVAVELAIARPGLVAGLALAAPAPLTRIQDVHVPVLLYRRGRILEHPALFARALAAFALRVQLEPA